jgi:hypothetical protein
MHKRRLAMLCSGSHNYARSTVLCFLSLILVGTIEGAGVRAPPRFAMGQGLGRRGGLNSRASEPPPPQCNVDIISVKRQGPVVKEGLPLEKVLYHVGWFAGLEDVAWCHKHNPAEPYPPDQLPPIENKACVDTMALQGKMTNPINLPIKDDTKQFFSCMDSRSAYAGLGTPGGDMGEFINAINAAETIIGFPFTPDDVYHFFTRYVGDMVEGGKNYFSMCSDQTAVDAWLSAAKIDGSGPLLQRWNPLDTEGRRRLLRLATKVEHVGCQHLKNMLEDEKSYKVRKGLVESAMLAFYAVYFDPFNKLREHLLFPVQASVKQAPTAVLNVETPFKCRPMSPLVVPKIHTVVPTLGEESLKSGKPASFLETDEESRAGVLSSEGASEGSGSGSGVDLAVGTEVLVYHFTAAADHRRMLANYFGPKFGLNTDVYLAKINNLGENGVGLLTKKLADKMPRYLVSFFPENPPSSASYP